MVKVDISSGVMRPLVPAELRRRVFEAIHRLAHPGIRATRRLIGSRYLWPGLAKDVQQWCRECQECQRAKAGKWPSPPMRPIPVPTIRFSHNHVDLEGPLPVTADGSQYILTAIDRSKRWVEAFPLKAVAASNCAEDLVNGWVARYCVLACLTSDLDLQFASAVWVALMSCLGIKQVMTMSYHPQSNGVVERFHQRLKDALRARTGAAD
jgi:transposase InsO family protein